jgi:hypothetical protein
MRAFATALFAALAALVVTGGACLQRPSFECTQSSECSGVGAGAVCEADGFCSFTDEACDSGRRYGELSGPNAGECVGGDVAMPRCYGSGAYSACVTPPPTDAIDLAGALDTDTDPRCLAVQPADWAGAGQPDACFLAGTDITVSAAVTVSGSRPLVVLGDAIQIDALLDVASHRGGALGAGANASACAAFGGDAGDAAPIGGGGAGGSFGTGGGNGGRANNNNNIPGGLAAAPDGASPTVLRGGCPGQVGGTGNAAAGAPGAGGGAIYLAATTIDITASGVINASGGAAAAGGDGAGGSGGGAGGMIVLFADTITAAGTIVANGGGASSGGRDGQSGNDGRDPSTMDVTVPGGGGRGPGGDGGDGFALGRNARDGGTGANRAGGGGGGGGGYIQANHMLSGGSVSPAAAIAP